MKTMDDFCRKNREKSISPSISFDVSQSATPEEKAEKAFYSNTKSEMAKELFASFDDIFRYINHLLKKNIKNSVKSINFSDAYLETMIREFLDAIFSKITSSYDTGESLLIKLLDLTQMNKDLAAYLTKKVKRRSLANLIDDTSNVSNNSSSNFLSPIKKFDTEKNKFANLIRENLILKIEYALEKKLSEKIQKENLNTIKEKFVIINENIKKKKDLSFVDKNLDLISNKLKIMKRDLRQIKDNQLNNI